MKKNVYIKATHALITFAYIIATLQANITHDAASKVFKSVVKINVTRATNTTMLQPESSFMPFAHKTDKQNAESMYGSGFVVDTNGHIATNLHVLGEEGTNISNISVVLHTGESLPAKIVGYDRFLDILVLKIESNNLSPIVWGDSTQVLPTHSLYAFGHPLGFDNSIVKCFVSAINRDISDNELITSAQNFPDGITRNIIQLDGNLNPGLSGAVVTNEKGEGVAMASSNFGHDEHSVGVGFCLPMNAVRPVIEAIIKNKGIFARGALGVQAQDLDSKTMESKGLKEIKGVLISEVYSDSAAASANILQGDIILSINGQLVMTASQLRYVVKTLPLNKKLPVELLRDGKIMHLNIVLTPSKETEEFIQVSSPEDLKDDTSILSTLGLKLNNLTPELALSYGFAKNTKGVLIESFTPSRTLQTEINLKTGDLIEEVDNQPVKTTEDVEKLLTTALKNQKSSVLLLIHRPEGKKFEALTLQ